MQNKRLAVHRPGQRHNCALALPHDAQCTQWLTFGLGQHLRRGEQALQPGPGCCYGFTKPLDQPLRQRTRRRHGDLLAQHGAHREFEPVHSTGHTQAVALRKVGM